MYPIRRGSHFLLDTQPSWETLKRRLRIRYGEGYVASPFLEHRAEPDKWSWEQVRFLKNATHGVDHTPASIIN